LTSGAPETTDGSLVKSAARTLDIFELLATEPTGLTISEISARLGYARSSVHALVHTLRSKGYLAYEPDGRFQLGVRLIHLGLNVVDRLEIRTAARDRLERLVAQTDHTALLVVPEAGEILYVDKIVSDARGVRADPRMSSLGHPLHCSSVGKALLAAVDDATVREVVGDETLAAATDYSLTRVGALLEDLADTRRRGYSIDRQEAVVGIWCVGAPLRDHTGRSIAAISLSTIKDFFDPGTLGALITSAAVDVSQALGWEGDAADLYRPVAGSELALFHRPPAPAVVEQPA
jgi:DNA-binding IclR family transcriptional regulator